MTVPDSVNLDVRGRGLRASLVALMVKADAPELQLLHRWLDTWSGIGLIAVGMHRQGLRLSLSHIADGEWRCYFMGDGALLAPRGFGVAPTPWRAVQIAAWAAVNKARRNGRRARQSAQTCAALAAFVGAVGLYRLQSLGAGHVRNEHTVRGLLSGRVLAAMDAAHLPLADIIRTANANRTVIGVEAALTEWNAYPGRRQGAIYALFAFETWNLLMIFAALVGFNHVAALAACPWTLRALWPVAVGTVVVTGYCVYVWTKDGANEQGSASRHQLPWPSGRDSDVPSAAVAPSRRLLQRHHHAAPRWARSGLRRLRLLEPSGRSRSTAARASVHRGLQGAGLRASAAMNAAE